MGSTVFVVVMSYISPQVQIQQYVILNFTLNNSYQKSRAFIFSLISGQRARKGCQPDVSRWLKWRVSDMIIHAPRVLHKKLHTCIRTSWISLLKASDNFYFWIFYCYLNWKPMIFIIRIVNHIGLRYYGQIKKIQINEFHNFIYLSHCNFKVFENE